MPAELSVPTYWPLLKALAWRQPRERHFPSPWHWYYRWRQHEI